MNCHICSKSGFTSLIQYILTYFNSASLQTCVAVPCRLKSCECRLCQCFDSAYLHTCRLSRTLVRHLSRQRSPSTASASPSPAATSNLWRRVSKLRISRAENGTQTWAMRMKILSDEPWRLYTLFWAVALKVCWSGGRLLVFLKFCLIIPSLRRLDPWG